jgi:hypothetical protein
MALKGSIEDVTCIAEAAKSIGTPPNATRFTVVLKQIEQKTSRRVYP